MPSTALAVQTSGLPLPDCAQPGCLKPTRPRGQLCAMHAKRLERGTPLHREAQEQLAPWARVLDAALDYADAPSEDDAEADRREAALRVYIVRWVRSNGWVNPAATEQLANSVARAVEHRRSGEISEKAARQETPPRPRQAVRQGPERQPARRSGVGEGDARAGGQPRSSGDRAAGAADALPQDAERRSSGRGGVARPGGAEAVLHRADRNRRAR